MKNSTLTPESNAEFSQSINGRRRLVLDSANTLRMVLYTHNLPSETAVAAPVTEQSTTRLPVNSRIVDNMNRMDQQHQDTAEFTRLRMAENARQTIAGEIGADN